MGGSIERQLEVGTLLGAPARSERDLRGPRIVSREYYGLSIGNGMGGELG